MAYGRKFVPYGKLTIYNHTVETEKRYVVNRIMQIS